MDWIARLLRDFRYATHSLLNSPGLSGAMVVTLALGIGANTAIFSVLQGIVLAPLPFTQPGQLVEVALFNRSLGYATDLSYPDFLDWQRDSHSFTRMAAFANESFDLTNPGNAVHVDGLEVSSSFFATLGVPFALGRAISPEEDRSGGRPSVVIGNALWRNRFGGSVAVLGKTLTLNGVDYTIIGVLRPEFRFGEVPADVYTPIARRNPMYIGDRTVHDIQCVARLRPDVSVSQALAEMNTVQQHIDELNPNTERGLGAYVIPLKRAMVGDTGETLFLLLGAVCLVLLIATANVANLLLARSAGRSREFAIRLALGASRAQVVRQLFVESLELSLVGGVLGLAIAGWGVKAALAAVPGTVPRAWNVGVNTPVLLYTLGVCVIVGFVFGLFPALKSVKTNVQSGLAAGGRGVVGGHQRIQTFLAVLQISLAMVLLTGGSLLFRTIRNLWSVNPGFNAEHMVTFQIGFSPAVTSTPQGLRTTYQSLVDRIRHIPGVEAADLTALVPLSRAYNEGPFWIGPHQPASMAQIPRAIYYPAGPEYVKTMQIPLLGGRFLTPSDSLQSGVVVLVDETLARRFFPGQSAIGHSITIPHWGKQQNIAARIVGVVGHVEHYQLDGSMGEKPQIYYSFYQLPDEALPVFRGEVTMAVRTQASLPTIMPAIRKAVSLAGSDQPVYHVRTMRELVAGSMARQRLTMFLLVSFALLALLLAWVGVYGLVSYSTAGRVREMGIRIALGARNMDVFRLILGWGLRLAVTGAALGAIASLVLAKVVSSFSNLLYGVRPNDPAMLGGVSLLLGAAAVLACYFPARRAARLDPATALRQE